MFVTKIDPNKVVKIECQLAKVGILQLSGGGHIITNKTDIKNMINNICYGCSYNGSVCCKYLVERK